MAPKDLDLEFEDEAEEAERLKREEEEKKRRAALNPSHNADLEFSVPGMDAAPAAAKGAPTPAKPHSAPTTKASTPSAHKASTPANQSSPEKTGAQVVPLESAKREGVRREAGPNYETAGVSSDRLYSETEVNALIRAAVAESRLEMISDLTAETKDLEIKVTRILMALAAKAPALKKEFAPIQKMLQDHTRCPLLLTQKQDKKKAA